MAYPKDETVRKRFHLWRANQQAVGTLPLYSSDARAYGRTKTGIYLPNWKKIISSGGNATTVFSGIIYDLQYTDANSRVDFDTRPAVGLPWESKYSLNSSWLGFYSIDALNHFSSLTAAVVAKAKAKAIQQLYRQIWSAHHQLQGGVVLGEIGKTAKMLAKTAHEFRKGVLDYVTRAVDLRKGRGSRKSRTKAIADTYLEAVFGWQPLLHDSIDLAKAMGRLVHESDRVRFRAFGSEEVQHSRSVGGHTYGFLYMINNTVELVEVKCLYRGFLRGPRYEAGSPPADRIVSMLGFDLRSFIPTLWELTPYSFLVDYFTNVGDVLQAVCTDTSGVYGLWYSEVQESRREVTLTPDSKTSITNLTSVYGANLIRNIQVTGGVGKVISFRRDVSRAPTGMPLMVPQFTGLDLSTRQFTNIGALITSKTR